MASLPQAPQDYDIQQFTQILTQIETRLARIEAAAATGYATSNVTETRTLDADTATISELSDVVGTLIDDLKQKGVLA